MQIQQLAPSQSHSHSQSLLHLHSLCIQIFKCQAYQKIIFDQTDQQYLHVINCYVIGLNDPESFCQKEAKQSHEWTIDDIMKIRYFDVQAIVEKVKQQSKNKGTKYDQNLIKTERNAIFILKPKMLQKDNLYKSMIIQGLKSMSIIISSKNIRTKNDVITIQHDHNIPNKNILALIQDLTSKPMITAIIHGACLELQKFTGISQSHKMSNPSQKQQQPSSAPQAYTLITGGSRGIGKATAILLAQRGINLILTGRPGNKQLGQFCKSLQLEYKIKAMAMHLDIKQAKQCIQLSQALKQKSIKVGTLIYNSGVGTATSAEQSTADISKQTILLAVNSVGPVQLHQFLGKDGIFQDKGGVVIIISSIFGLRPYGEFNIFDQISKNVLEAWYQQLKSNHRQSAVFVVYPGPTDTEMFQKSTLNGIRQKGQENFNSFLGQLPKSGLATSQQLGYIVALCEKWGRGIEYEEKKEGLGVRMRGRIAAGFGGQFDYRALK